MNKTSKDNLSAITQSQNSALRVATVYAVANIPTLAFFFYLCLQTKDWQVYTMTGVLTVISALYFISLRWMRGGRVEAGVKLMLASTLSTVVIGILLFDGMGLMMGVTAVLLTVLLAYQGLPAPSVRWALMIAAGVGVFAAVWDERHASYRLRVPAMDVFAPGIILLALLAAVIVVAFSLRGRTSRRWQASIRNRLTLIVVGSSIVPVVLVSILLGTATYIQVRNALQQDAFEKLAAVQTIKVNQVNGYFEERQSDMIALSDTVGSVFVEARAKMDAISVLKRDQIVRLFHTWDADVRDVASDPGVVVGMHNLALGFQELGNQRIRALYMGQPDLQAAADESFYSAAHAEQHSFFQGYIGIHGYLDALLIDPAGNVVYSVNKSEAFGANLATGIYRDTKLGQLYREVITTATAKSYIADAAFFEDGYVMFIAAPIFNGSTLEGILVYQLPLNVINELMSERTGQGETGETFLIAREKDGRITYRSDRPVVGNGEYVIGYDLTSIASKPMLNALDGNTGGGLAISSTGDAVINSYRPLEIEGLNWAVFARVEAAEALSPLHTATEEDFLSTYQQNYGYLDIFLVAPNGFVFYSVEHRADFGTNILTGTFKDTNFAYVVNEVIETTAYEFVDFAPYAPTAGRPAAFFASPVLDNNNEMQLIVVTQTSYDQLNAIMAETTGLGETGETFIVGHDLLRRTESRFLNDLHAESTILNPQFPVDTVASQSVLQGGSGQATFDDYRGIPVMGVWSPIDLIEAENSSPEAELWGVIAQMDTAEALAPVNQLARAIGLVVGLAALVIGALAVVAGTRLASSFVKPILTLTESAAQIAAGKLDVTVKTETADELGTLSNAFNTMTTQLRDLISSLEQRVAARTRDLATVAEVGTATATILESKRLLQEVVDLTRERFNLYHSHIYLLDEKGENLVLTAGAGEPGRIMVAEGRSIPLNREKSLVARAARERKGVTVNDVTQAPDFLPNPLLPDTRSELAVPMIVGGHVIGVFDIQSDLVGRFTEADINIQTTLAAQVAISIQNVRSFEQAKTQAELESLVNSIGQKIQRSATVEDTLQIAVREVGLALGASRVRAHIQANRQAELSQESVR